MRPIVTSHTTRRHFSRRCAPVTLALAGAMVLATALSPALAIPEPQVQPREAMRLHLLDTCVINSSRTNESTVNYADRCRCATDRTMCSITEEEVASIGNRRGIAGSVEASFNENWQRCG